MALLDIRGLKTHFHTDDGWLHAVDGVDMSVDAGRNAVRGRVNPAAASRSPR